MAKEIFAEVILPFALEKNYTYSVPVDMEVSVSIGMRVEVSFRNKTYTGIIKKLHSEKPQSFQAKPILSFPDHLNVVNKIQLDFWSWMASYYLCSQGDVMNAALPAPYKLSSETIIVLADEAKIDATLLDDKEYLIAEALTIQKELTLKDIQQIVSLKTIQPLIKSLIQKGIAFVKEELHETYAPKQEKFISLNDKYAEEEALKELFTKLEKYPGQLNILMTYYQLKNKDNSVKKSLVIKKSGQSAAVLKTLIKNNIFNEIDKYVSRLTDHSEDIIGQNNLTQPQQQALVEIRNEYETKNTVLLHGVTGSGKTEIYIELIKSCIAENKQVLYLLPEIALTTQVISRLKKRFGKEIGVYHSKFNQNERVEIWQKVIAGEYKILLGARSAIFLPFTNLGLIIVDEEHDYSYKQQEPNPRYHGRDSAIYLAYLHKAKTLLGTATPSMETYYQSVSGKYGLVRLHERYAGIQMPDIELINIPEKREKKLMHSLFSNTLIDKINATIEVREQVILFQNRRGYAPYLICEQCGWIPKCIQCDVNLVYHKYADELRCHYCGYKHKTYPTCPACGSTKITIQGFGTEKIQDELEILVPGKKIARLDLDAVKTKYSHERIIREFEHGEIDILVGTQMVTKGLDFDNVNLVGIMNADQVLNFSDFRAHERAFQMITQVSGRAGRKTRKGLVLIQTNQINHPVLKYVVENDFNTFFENEIQQRKNFNYPPFSRLVQLKMKHAKQEIVNKAATHFTTELKKLLGKRILGPASPSIARIKNKYIQEVLIKIENNRHTIEKIKDIIKVEIQKMEMHPLYKKVEIYCDVDPY